jgi:N6-adenosine-specific RNA methylase IME4
MNIHASSLLELNVLGNFSRKYRIIYADPPWTFSTWSPKGRDRSPKYPEMSIGELTALDVRSLADDACCLAIWVTWPSLAQVLKLIEAWGFRFSTCGFVWVKTTTRGGIRHAKGYTTRQASEVCLFARHKHMPPVIDHAVSQIVMEPVREHSRKPDCVRERLVALFGDVPRLELFARRPAAGWDAMGDQLVLS